MVNAIMKGVFLLSVATLIGCQATTGHYLGGLADSDNLIWITTSPVEEQRWQDIYLTVDSVLQWQNQNSLLAGQVAYSQHPRMMYQRANRVTLWVFLLDENKRVVSYQMLPGIFPGSTDESIRFSLPLPYHEHAVSYTFGYEVTFADEEGDGHSNWNLPRTGR